MSGLAATRRCGRMSGIVAATHQNLEQLVAEGKFRMDLFYRLNVFPIQVAPLRERAGDIPCWSKVTSRNGNSNGSGSLRLSNCALASLARYFWPGNVRELFNLLERLSILFPGRWYGGPICRKNSAPTRSCLSMRPPNRRNRWARSLRPVVTRSCRWAVSICGRTCQY